MKKLIFSILLLITGAFAALAQTYDVQLNLQPNQRVPLRHIVRNTTEVMVPGQGTQETVSTITVEMAFFVTEIKGENYIINGILNKYELTIDVGGQKMTYSGSDKEVTSYNKELVEATGKVFVAEINKKFELVGDVKPLNDDMTEEGAKNAFDALSQVFRGLYPSGPIEKGATWEDDFENDGGKTHVVGTLTDVNDNSYILDAKLDAQMDEDGVVIKGTGVGNYEINRALGVPVYGLSTLPMEGSVVTPMGKINLTMNTVSSFELIL